MVNIISIINNKGGVSKTTSAINIAAYMAKANKKVLIIDFDAQANATIGTIGEQDSHVGEWLVGEKNFEEVVKNYIPNLDVLPARRALDTYQKAIGAEQDYQFVLKEKIESEALDTKYDIIIIDNAPSLSTLAYTTFIAATHLLIPSSPEEFSVSGIHNIIQTMMNVKKRYNPDLKLIGIFFSKYHPSYRSRIDSDIVESTRETYKDLVLNTTIRNNVSVKEAMAYKQPLYEYAPTSHGATDYDELTKEIINRL